MINSLHNLTESHYFASPIYLENKPEWINYINNICDKYIDEAKEKNIIKILEQEEKFKKKINDFGMSHHSNNLAQDKNLLEFINYISKTSWDILEHIGYNLTNYNLYLNDLWVQQFSEKGGGHHEGHVHSNCHISGFYFLKCSDKTSFPIFHDPRYSKSTIQLPLKNENELNSGNEKIHFKPEPGTLLYFPAYLKHQFAVDYGVEPFRFIHFNLQAFEKINK
jgi:uncharacterized protein (TIGR02466 family)